MSDNKNQNLTDQSQNLQRLHPSILNQTLGQLLQNNQQVQGMVMQSMQINPQQLQQLLGLTGNNQLMNTKIGDLFKNGFMGQVIGQSQVVQMNPQQFQQIVSSLNLQNQPGQLVNQQVEGGQAVGPNDTVPYVIPQLPPKQSFLQKLKKIFT